MCLSNSIQITPVFTIRHRMIITKYIYHSPLLLPTMTDQKEESADVKKRIQKEYHRLVKGDEFAYVIGVANLTFSAWLCGAFPAGYWMYHCVKLTALLLYRIYHWINIKMSFFLVEYCYIVNYSILIFYLLSYFQNGMFRSIIPQFYVHQKDIFRGFFFRFRGERNNYRFF